MNAPLSAPSRSDQTLDQARVETTAKLVDISPAQAPRAHKGKSWMLSLTGVCFVFGALMAMQLRATQQMRDNRVKEKQGVAQAATLAAEMKTKAADADRERLAKDAQLTALKDKLAKSGSLSATQVAALNGQIKDLQTVAGLTNLVGPGIRITLSDDPAVAGGDPSQAMPGLVHDFDLQQVVNELRSAKAEAIAIYGAGGDPVRVTGYTPIRCVGPTIMVNWEGVAAPFTIEAIGNPNTLTSAMMMAGGIVDNLKTNATIGVKVEKVDRIELPAAMGGMPKMRVAKPEATDAEKANAAADHARKEVAAQ